jgi:hypothetical protein
MPALLNDQRNRERMFQAMNRDNTDDVCPIGGAEREMKVLSEMNSLTDDHEQFLRSLEACVANLA